MKRGRAWRSKEEAIKTRDEETEERSRNRGKLFETSRLLHRTFGKNWLQARLAGVGKSNGLIDWDARILFLCCVLKIKKSNKIEKNKNWRLIIETWVASPIAPHELFHALNWINIVRAWETFERALNYWIYYWVLTFNNLYIDYPTNFLWIHCRYTGNFHI